MRYVNLNLAWAVPAIIAVSVMWGVSACANWYAGASFGDSTTFNALLFETTTSQIFSSASLASDVLKSVMLFAAAAALTMRHFKAALVTGSIWFVCTLWSVISATGFVAFNQGNVTDARGKTAAEWSQLERQITNLEQRRAEVKPHRPQTVLEAEIDGILQIPGIDGCATINGPITSKYCPQLTALRAELGYAESASWLDGRLNELRVEQKASARVTSENPWADLIASLFGASATQVMTGRALYLALMLELISGPGFWAIWAAFASVSQKPSEQRAPAAEPRKAAPTSPPGKSKTSVLGPMAQLQPSIPPIILQKSTDAPKIVIDNDKPIKASQTISRLDTPDLIVKRWLADYAPQSAGQKVVLGKNARRHHREWCRTAGPKGKPIKPIDPSPLGKSLARLGVKSEPTVNGVLYTFNPEATEVEKIAATG